MIVLFLFVFLQTKKKTELGESLFEFCLWKITKQCKTFLWKKIGESVKIVFYSLKKKETCPIKKKEAGILLENYIWENKKGFFPFTHKTQTFNRIPFCQPKRSWKKNTKSLSKVFVWKWFMIELLQSVHLEYTCTKVFLSRCRFFLLSVSSWDCIFRVTRVLLV